MNVQGNKGEIVIYQTEDGQTFLEVSLVEDTVWLDTHQMADLFQRDRTVVVRHIRNIYKTGELLPDSTCAKIAQVAKDGKKRVMGFYNLDMIISVGYRVNSLRGTQFRIWANKILKDYLVKGYTLNEKRLQLQIEKYEAVIQNYSSPDLKVWDYPEKKNRVRMYLWPEPFDYAVILEKNRGKRKHLLTLITAFYVEGWKKKDLIRRYQKRIE